MLSFSHRRTALSVLAALTLAACGSAPKNTGQDIPRAPIKSVALIPALSTPLVFEYSASLFVPPVVRAIMNRSNSNIGEANAKVINDAFATQGYDTGKRLTEDVVKQLQDSGLVVEVLDTLVRKPKSPDDIDYTKIVHNSDVILHLYLNEVTYQSPRGQSAYWPRTSTTVHAYDKTGKTYLFQADTYLNRGAKESRPGNFDAKEELSFADQDTMLVQIDKVRANLEQVSKQAAQYLGTRVVEQSR